ncbi:hypothetical protein NQD34_013443 [Periophthalmus magnuspinnatus]|nr:hypothetical protein NQD34_013443 [Periophthalmus magnuspinnatus]
MSFLSSSQTRLRRLSEQKTFLCRGLAERDALEQEVRSLVEALEADEGDTAAGGGEEEAESAEEVEAGLKRGDGPQEVVRSGKKEPGAVQSAGGRGRSCGRGAVWRGYGKKRGTKRRNRKWRDVSCSVAPVQTSVLCGVVLHVGPAGGALRLLPPERAVSGSVGFVPPPGPPPRPIRRSDCYE